MMPNQDRALRRQEKIRLGALVSVLLSIAGGCSTGADLQQQTDALVHHLTQARAKGAYHCAPRLLALTEAEVEFADYELSEGDLRRAEQHFDRAKHAKNALYRQLDTDVCRQKRDTDADGISDAEDQCIDEPEDLDGFEDKNGCPDPDNDGDQVLDPDDQCPLEPGDSLSDGCPVPDSDGDGIGDPDDACPDAAEDMDAFNDEDGCPEQDDDRDRDGVIDLNDNCPDEAEDKDGFEDDDGCPEKDNDFDGVLDSLDACPNEAGEAARQGCPIRDRDHDGVIDEADACPDIPGNPPEGCPQRVLVEKTDSEIHIKEKILFRSNKAVFRGPMAGEILDQIAGILKANPQMRVSIEGHTDNVGAADYNLKLSDARAHAVRDGLIKRGVEADRLDAIGYGESKPLKPNDSEAGRRANRRVMFKIVQ